jgi:acyl-CoA reductase-like NAD-dependent aldehyde dehydrogenase
MSYSKYKKFLNPPAHPHSHSPFSAQSIIVLFMGMFYFYNMKSYPVYIAGSPVYTEHTIDVLNPWDQSLVAKSHIAGPKEAESAIQAALRGFEVSRLLTACDRAAVLLAIENGLSERKDELANLICAEAGKPIQYARAEVERAIHTFRLAGAWVWQNSGEVMDLSHAPEHTGKSGIVKYFPVGPCLLISPFNFPLNLVAHKVAPAIAVGNSFVLKPASATPLTAAVLAEIIAASGYPKAAWSVLPCTRTTGQLLVEDPRFQMLSFTGSPEVGWKMKADAGKKKVILELGGDAAVIIDETANLDEAIPKLLHGAFAYAGQICISVQRIIATKEIYTEVKHRLLQAISDLPFGDPQLPHTVCGPMIDPANAQRTLKWIQEAQQAGATLLAGGKDLGNQVVSPAILEHIPKGCDLRDKEAFAPVVGLYSAERFEDAVDIVNDSAFGLQTGVFTRYEDRLKYAFQHLHVGGIIHNHVPTLRIDAMPYGGIKDSGLGREGIAWACRDMSEPKVLVW